MHAKGEGSMGGLPLPSYEGPGVSPLENFWKYRCRSMQFGAFLATSATDMYNTVFSVDFGRSIWWHRVIKSGTEFRATFYGIYRLCRIGFVALNYT